MSDILEKFKPSIDVATLKSENGIYLYQNPAYLKGDNEKYMEMYDWMSVGYDFAEKWVGRIKYGDSIAEMRRYLMSRLSWQPGSAMLYVSIGTGADLAYVPDGVDLQTIDLAGVDISLGMLKRCHAHWAEKANLGLVNCAAEDLPFADDSFDVVFHVGGINFFNDKALAVREMLRVAKPGTKLMIADETADYVDEQYKKSAMSKKYFEGATVDLGAIEACIPDAVKDRQTELIWDDRFYCITFCKP